MSSDIDASSKDFEIHIDADCLSPAMEEAAHAQEASPPLADEVAPIDTEHTDSTDPAAAELVVDEDPDHGTPAPDHVESTTEPDTEEHGEDPTLSVPSTDSLDDLIQDGYAGDNASHAGDHEPPSSSEAGDTETETHNDAASSLLDPCDLEGESVEGSHRGTDDDVFSDRSPRSSVHSSNDHYGDSTMEQTTEKGQESPYARSRVASGVSASGASVVSDFSRLSCYDKDDDHMPTSRKDRPAFRSPSSVRALQMSSPTPSIITSPTRSTKRQSGSSTSRLGSPIMSGQFSPKGRLTPSRFKKQEAPLVLLHVTLLPLRWGYGDVINHFEAKKLAPLVFSSEGIKNLRGAWRQLQDRLGDTVLERGILLPHPQNDYEVLEERLLEALELPVRRRARILECGHYLGPANRMSLSDGIEDEIESSDAEGSGDGKQDKRHWCKTCRGEIKYEELGADRVFRIKVYASNGLMSAGAWDACWKEMERVDIEVEPIMDASIHADLAKLSAAFDLEHQQILEAEQKHQEEEELRFQMEAEHRLSLEEERQHLEAQRQQFEEERRQTMEASQKQLEEERRRLEEEQRQRLEEERRLQFEEERQLLDAQRLQFEEQREELEQQRKFVVEEQRQHLEEARRQELELEQKLIEEQRQELEAARQQFEDERRQRLEEEEELRRLQREEDEQKHLAASRSASRSSYVEDDPPSPATERATSPELKSSHRDSERLREIYGADGRASSTPDRSLDHPSPSIHIHVDSARQRIEEQSSHQLALSAPPSSGLVAEPAQESLRQDSFHSLPPTLSPPQPVYQRQEAPRRALDAASLPELLGESIRVLLQDPKNVAIAVLVVFLAVLMGQFATRQERGVELYKPQQPQYQHHQLDSREPVAHVIMNTPARVETVYHTVTAEPAPQKAPVTKEVEIVYHTVTQSPSQETVTRVVETIYSTVTAQAPELASESTPSSADPSPDIVSGSTEDEASTSATVFSLVAPGLDPFVCLASATSEPESDEPNLKTAATDEPSDIASGADALLPPDVATHQELSSTISSSASHSPGVDGDGATTTPGLTTSTTSTDTQTKTVTETETTTETIMRTVTS